MPTKVTLLNPLPYTGTIEDKILQLQEQKRGVVDAALGQGGERQTESNKLTAEDLTFLFS